MAAPGAKVRRPVSHTAPPPTMAGAAAPGQHEPGDGDQARLGSIAGFREKSDALLGQRAIASDRAVSFCPNLPRTKTDRGIAC